LMLANGQASMTPGLKPGDIVSRCGLLCNTCSAYIAGICPGCPNLEQGECVLRDCADLKGTSCLDCQATSCHHFEAYVWRRRVMNAQAKEYMRLAGLMRRRTPGAACGCAAGGGTAKAGCGGCSVRGGCPAARLAASLSALGA